VGSVPCGDQNLRVKKKRSETQPDTLIAKTVRTLLDFTTKTLSQLAGVLTDLSKYVPNLVQSALCQRHQEGKRMITYIIVSIISGVLFGGLDGLINVNPLAQSLYEVYKPVAKTSINALAGITIDLIYGFVMAGVFLLLYQSLPGEVGLVKGVCFAIIIWFFRVVMYVASQWVMFNVPVNALLYTLVTGLGEMLILGILYGLTLKPPV
jgi:lysylphosphatidylglycerol synthetase-like protein (DUF2156 family)